MKRNWISRAAVVLLVLAAVLMIAQRLIPQDFSGLMPENYSPEQCTVIFYDWDEDVKLTGEKLETLMTLLCGLQYRYDGNAWGGVMKGELYHLSFFQQEPPEMVYLFVTTQRGIVYINDREYEMLGDTKPLLDFLNALQ